jgi:hypothetical protein
MFSGPVVTSETQKSQKETCDVFTHDMDKAVDDFISKLYGIAKSMNDAFFSFTLCKQTMTSEPGKYPMYCLSLASQAIRNCQCEVPHPTVFSMAQSFRKKTMVCF